MKNASMSDTNRNKSRDNVTNSREIQIETIDGRLGSERIDNKFYSCIGLET